MHKGTGRHGPRRVKSLLCTVFLNLNPFTVSALRHCSQWGHCCLRVFSSEAENVGCATESVISQQLLHLWPWHLVHLRQLECFISEFQVKIPQFLLFASVISRLKALFQSAKTSFKTSVTVQSLCFDMIVKTTHKRYLKSFALRQHFYRKWWWGCWL